MELLLLLKRLRHSNPIALLSIRLVLPRPLMDWSQRLIVKPLQP